MIKNQYETLRDRVLNRSVRNQEFILFVECGLIGWMESLAACPVFSLPKRQEAKLSTACLSDALQNQATQLLTDMVCYCLKEIRPCNEQ